LAKAEGAKIRHWSAVAYHFGLTVHKELKIPVGLVQSAVGGTPAEAWMSMKTLKADEDYKEILQRGKEALKKRPELQAKYDKALEKWQKLSEEAKAAGKKVPKRPGRKKGLRPGRLPSQLYNGMVYPFGQMAIRGVIWYQGESNGKRAYQYRKLFPALINNWRQLFNNEKLPFLFVQIANLGRKKPGLVDMPADSLWPELREAQTLTLKLPFTAMAVTYDLPTPADDIHFKPKAKAGQRLGKAALAMVYGKNIVYQGPFYKSMIIEDGKAILSFENCFGGLEVKGEELKGFAIAGKDHKFVWAKAEVKDGKVVVWCDKVSNPVAVRYAWDNYSYDCNLYNKEGFPAVPFRTDDRPGVTAGRK